MLERTVEFVGCFNDNNGGRDLVGNHIENLRGSGKGAVLECATACQGYTYMGLQWSDECFCGNAYGSQGEAALSECDSDGDVSEGIADMCGVDGQETCGNHNAICKSTERALPRRPNLSYRLCLSNAFADRIGTGECGDEGSAGGAQNANGVGGGH